MFPPRRARPWRGVLTVFVLAAIVGAGAVIATLTLRRSPDPFAPDHLHDVIFDRETDAILVAGHDGVWRLTPTRAVALGPVGMHVEALTATEGLILAAGAPQSGSGLTGVMQSDDGGRTWATTGSGGGLDVRALTLDGVDVIAADGSPPRILASAARVVWRERSSGQLVTRFATDPQQISQPLGIIDGVLQRGYDGGHGWRVDPVATMPAVALVGIEWPAPSLLYVLSADDHLFASADSGRTWQPVGRTPKRSAAVAAREDGQLAIVTTDGRAAISQDGRTWTELSPKT